MSNKNKLKGIIRRIFKQGDSNVLAIPPILLDVIGIKQGDKVRLELKDGGIFVKGVEGGLDKHQ